MVARTRLVWLVMMAASVVCAAHAFVIPMRGRVQSEPHVEVAPCSQSNQGFKQDCSHALIGVTCGVAALCRKRYSRHKAEQSLGQLLLATSRVPATWGRQVNMQATEAATGITEGSPLRLFSPAKINLFLRILRRRDDGYHDLASLFHTVSLGDDLDLELLPEGSEHDELECNIKGVPVDDSNLVIRAFNLFRSRTGIQRFFRVKLEKCTPAEAGMGGGSSNAATALYGANELCGRPASSAELLEWANDPIIGSDAAFFLSEGCAFCTGRGEIVTPIERLPIEEDLPIFLIKPNYGLSTPKVFKALNIESVSSESPEEILETFQKRGVSHDTWINDLENPAFDVCPELFQLLTFLKMEKWGFQAVLMSGSGTTIFCIGRPKRPIAEVEAEAREKFDIQLFEQAKFVHRASDQWFERVGDPA